MANFNMNKVILGGRLIADPELKTTSTGVKVAKFRIAVRRQYSGKEQGEPVTDFFSCTAWKGTAEFISRYFSKASSICISGSLQIDSYQDRNGINRSAPEIVVSEAYFVDSKSDSASQAQETPNEGNISTGSETAPQAPQDMSQYNLTELREDEELPF